MAEKRLTDLFSNKRVAILGFGKEGRSTFRWLKKNYPGQSIAICDRNESLSGEVICGIDMMAGKWYLGRDYLRGLEQAELIIRSPGISFSELSGYSFPGRITSQTELFLQEYRDQVTGITGTKGKSTTASILEHIIRMSGQPVVLAGNIGVPCFDLLDHIGPETQVVFEMSSHQLQNIRVSPRIAVLLNIFEEHLDHYASFDAYQQAKMNIVKWQGADDICIAHSGNPYLSAQLSSINVSSRKVSVGSGLWGSGNIVCQGDDLVFSYLDKQETISGLCKNRLLAGDHNLDNIAAAVGAAIFLGISAQCIYDAVSSFRGLPHRMEYAGVFDGVAYYNDSIATIPEATIAALKALPQTATLILGGKDRGVNYERLIDFVGQSGVEHVLFTGDAGARMYRIAKETKKLEGKWMSLVNSFDDAVLLAKKRTPAGKICLLSPAAASYDAFRDFEERGDRFKALAAEKG